MNIPIGVEVHCTDGVCGESTYVIIHPVGQKVTHVVVKDRKKTHPERLVNIKWVAETTGDLIRLSCTKAELAKMKPFVKTQFLDVSLPGCDTFEVSGYFVWHYRVPERKVRVEVKHKSIPPGELAVRRGASVHCTAGKIGRVDEFIVDPAYGHITHMILRKGHLWDDKDVTIPVSEIKRMDEADVYLKLDKRSVEVLLSIPVHPLR